MYDETSFMQGFTCGLSATTGRPLGETVRDGVAGYVIMSNVPSRECNMFVSMVDIKAPRHATILYEYGVKNGEKTRVFRTVKASPERQTFYHVYTHPQKINLRDFEYSVYIIRRKDTKYPYRAGFIPFPFDGHYQGSPIHYEYPGSPELVDKWLSWSSYGNTES